MTNQTKPVWKTGFEIELLAPKGKSRQDLAAALAGKYDGSVRRVFSHQSEPSAVEGMSHFEDLTLGFEAHDKNGRLIAKCVDDLTIRADLDPSVKSLSGWYRIVSDDSRLVRLMLRQCDAEHAQRDVLKPVADLFGTTVIREDDNIFQVKDDLHGSVALAPSLPGERERACEVVTAPLLENRKQALEGILEPSRDLGFSIPREAAVHIHFDATRLRKTRVFVRLMQILERYGDALKKLVGSNPNCVRLGRLPEAIFETIREPGFQNRGWKLALNTLVPIELSKFCDYNILNVIHDIPGKQTFEVRVFPGSMDAAEIARWADLFEAVLWYCVETAKSASLPDGGLSGFLAVLALPDNEKQFWLKKANTITDREL